MKLWKFLVVAIILTLFILVTFFGCQAGFADEVDDLIEYAGKITDRGTKQGIIHATPTYNLATNFYLRAMCLMMQEEKKEKNYEDPFQCEIPETCTHDGHDNGVGFNYILRGLDR